MVQELRAAHTVFINGLSLDPVAHAGWLTIAITVLRIRHPLCPLWTEYTVIHIPTRRHTYMHIMHIIRK